MKKYKDHEIINSEDELNAVEIESDVLTSKASIFQIRSSKFSYSKYQLFALMLFALAIIIYALNRALTTFKIQELRYNSLESLCSITEWRRDLFLNCTNVEQLPEKQKYTVGPQGTTNLRSAMLTCIRWAIDGGMGLILPKLAARKDNDIIYFNHWENYDYLFDLDMLRNTLQRECPQLKLYDTFHPVDQKVFSGANHQVHYDYGTYRQKVDDLARKANHTSDKTLVIWEDVPLLGWNFYREDNKIHESLYNAVNFRAELLSIASKVISLLPTKFVGIHLRNEDDMDAYTYNKQVIPLLEMMTNNFSYINTIYVAVGTPAIEEKFRNDMKAHDFDVISKRSLLNTTENANLYERMNSFSFDQRAVIDFQILKHAEYFFGIGLSSFAYGVAFERGNGDRDLNNCRCRIHGMIFSEFKCCY